jgi:hypothetical protein
MAWVPIAALTLVYNLYNLSLRLWRSIMGSQAQLGTAAMPKIIDYPRASLERALLLAETVDRLGGECSDQSAAEHMGLKVSGSFAALIGATVKYGLITNTKGKLKIEPLFQDYKLAYDDKQKMETLRKAFMTPPLFAAITKRFEGQVLPTHFEKLLIREHDVSEDFASRIVAYYSEGAKESGILAPNGTINSNPKHVTGDGDLNAGTDSAGPIVSEDEPVTRMDTTVSSSKRGYTLRIFGPGIDSTINLKDEDDLEIVEATLKKVRRLLKAQQDPLLS